MHWLKTRIFRSALQVEDLLSPKLRAKSAAMPLQVTNRRVTTMATWQWQFNAIYLNLITKKHPQELIHLAYCVYAKNHIRVHWTAPLLFLVYFVNPPPCVGPIRTNEIPKSPLQHFIHRHLLLGIVCQFLVDWQTIHVQQFDSWEYSGKGPKPMM